MSLKEKVVFKDYPLDAETTSSGVLRELEGQEAIVNALRLWISSFKGEIIRRPEDGGYITRWLMKPLNEETGIAIKRALLDGLTEDFTPVLIPTLIDVTPNYEKGFWEIHIEAYSPQFRETINVMENIRKLA